MKIAFFDSGVGGLTIFNKCIKQINSDYIYFADNLNTPYGLKDKETVKEIVIKNIEKLYNEYDPDIVVIACNTATSVAIKDLRKKYDKKCIIGTEPAVKVAADNNKIDKRILVCATTLTTKEEKLHNLIELLDIEKITDFLPLDKLVEYAENLDFDSENVHNYLKEQFSKIKLNEYSHIVLGCTHFPLFESAIKNNVPDGINIIDSSDGVVKNIISKINEFEKSEKNNVTLMLTKNDNSFTNKFSRIACLEDFEIKII